MTRDELLKLIEEARKDERTELSLSKNQLTEVPPEIGNLTNLTSLLLSENPLVEPFDELAQGATEDLLAYLRSLLDGVP